MVYRNCPRCAAVLDGKRECPVCHYKLRGRKPKGQQPAVVKPALHGLTRKDPVVVEPELPQPASTVKPGTGPGPIAPAPGALPSTPLLNVTATIVINFDLSKSGSLESLRRFLREAYV